MPTTTIAAEELTGLASSALTSSGMPQDSADVVADILVLADLFGIHTHGVQRVPQYVERAGIGGINPVADVSTEQLAPSLSIIDGDDGVGPLVANAGLRAALQSAKNTGVGAAFVRHSNHFGPVMPYLYKAASEGFAAIIASNATTTIAPWGGRATRIGNNPLGFGMPHPGADPILLDIALSVAARAKIRAAAADGRDIPDSWATDASGIPTTDPHAALDGFLQPIAGHKGYGLAVMVDLFAGLLSGAAYLDTVSSWSTTPEKPQNLGHFFILINTRLLANPDVLGERVDDFGARLHAVPAADPDQPVRLPGEIEMARYHRQRRDGVAVDARDVEALRNLAATPL
ncbi:Ldh family oxidoreductase [Mycolicibacterium sp. 018/SC-01/001]|uniref:Ldh family oxidoreductase n=1 Tax=Mycolicibacterium sp. 018/SC-01/001 TaxID=2592069 RepID=UPI00117F1068|nr:Ldh family oxidoreductase [Mycolicibacterium sp. 018/SC-01/001]TRW89128.1 Ldh family oxidoreductase [Mycolicibacterium sp. 018/SC-01/001]